MTETCGRLLPRARRDALAVVHMNKRRARHAVPVLLLACAGAAPMWPARTDRRLWLVPALCAVPPLRARVAPAASAQEALRLADQAFGLLGTRIGRAPEHAFRLIEEAAGQPSGATRETLPLTGAALALTDATLSTLISADATLSTLALTITTLILTIAALAALVLTVATLVALALVLTVAAVLGGQALGLIIALVASALILPVPTVLGVLLVAIVAGRGRAVALIV